METKSESKYERLRKIGIGSYGVVFKCINRQSGQIVAIKRYSENDSDPIIRKIAMREVRMLRQLKHPNLINLIEVFRRKRRLHLVFDYCELTVLDVIEKYGNNCPLNLIKKIVWQTVNGIDYCHARNCIHRDIKPENILINQSGVVKLCDFGFARNINKLPNGVLQHQQQNKLSQHVIGEQCNWQPIKASEQSAELAAAHMDKSSNGNSNNNKENVATSGDGADEIVGLVNFAGSAAWAAERQAMTEYVATRWYRAPELLIGEIYYDTKIDIWAIGCVTAELMRGEPIWPGKSDFDQLCMIKNSLGQLTASQTHTLLTQSIYDQTNIECLLSASPNISDPLERKLPARAGQGGIEFVLACLQMDPARRHTSEELLKHGYIHSARMAQFLKQETATAAVAVSSVASLTGIGAGRHLSMADSSVSLAPNGKQQSVVDFQSDNKQLAITGAARSNSQSLLLLAASTTPTKTNSHAHQYNQQSRSQVKQQQQQQQTSNRKLAAAGQANTNLPNANAGKTFGSHPLSAKQTSSQRSLQADHHQQQQQVTDAKSGAYAAPSRHKQQQQRKQPINNGHFNCDGFTNAQRVQFSPSLSSSSQSGQAQLAFVSSKSLLPIAEAYSTAATAGQQRNRAHHQVASEAPLAGSTTLAARSTTVQATSQLQQLGIKATAVSSTTPTSRHKRGGASGERSQATSKALSNKCLPGNGSLFRISEFDGNELGSRKPPITSTSTATATATATAITTTTATANKASKQSSGMAAVASLSAAANNNNQLTYSNGATHYNLSSSSLQQQHRNRAGGGNRASEQVEANKINANLDANLSGSSFCSDSLDSANLTFLPTVTGESSGSQQQLISSTRFTAAPKKTTARRAKDDGDYDDNSHQSTRLKKSGNIGNGNSRARHNSLASILVPI